jgi:Na+/H+ antiporter NhaD/arsenite permease-like protein
MESPEVVHEIATSTTLVFAGVLTAMVGGLALEEKIHAQKSVITGVAAAVSLLLGAWFGLLPGAYHHIPVYALGVHWEVIAIILGASLFVEVSSKSGMFSWMALWLTRFSKGDPVLLLVFYGGMTVVFSAFLNNVAAMLIVGSLTMVSLEKLGRTDKLFGFLMTEGLLTNVGGLLTLISSVPNIIVGQRAGIGFLDFFVMALPYVVVATLLTLAMAIAAFKIPRLGTEAEKKDALALVQRFEPSDTITSRGFFIYSGVMFALFVTTLSLTSFLPVVSELGMGFVALFFALMMLLVFKSTAIRKYQALDWDLLFFFITLFVVIDVMEHAGVLGVLGEGITALLELGPTAGPVALLTSSAVASSVTDNIPLAAVLANILGTTPGIEDQPGLWWCVIFGANLGGNITPIGSASTVVAVTLMHKAKLEVSFGKFVVTAVPFAIAQILLAIAYVLLVF